MENPKSVALAALVLATAAWLPGAAVAGQQPCQTGRDYPSSNRCACPKGSTRTSAGRSGNFRCAAAGGRVRGATTESAGGTLSTEEVESVISANLDALNSCVSANSRVTYATFDLKVTIATNGRVLDGRVGASVPDDARMRDCVVAAIRRAQFPSPHGGKGYSTAIAFQLMLEPTSSKPRRR